MTTRTKSKIVPGCLLIRFGTHRYTLLRVRNFGRVVLTLKRHCDGAEIEDWVDGYAHAAHCPCRTATVKA